MPWNISDVDSHKKNLSKKEKRKWVTIANAVLSKTGDEVMAIKIANSKTKKMKNKNLNESITITSVFVVSFVIFILSIMGRILDLIRIYKYQKSNDPDRFEHPIDQKRTKIVQKIINNNQEPIVHFVTGSPELNAYSDGSIHIYYTIPLERLCTERELIAVLLHEYGHYKEKHISHRYKTYLVSDLILST
ncbi:MAG: M48 family metalloprotease [Crenarchaeota archaeon]|nr:M48 family metalloprotease [Thermoproteota archaeon]